MSVRDAVAVLNDERHHDVNDWTLDAAGDAYSETCNRWLYEFEIVAIAQAYVARTWRNRRRGSHQGG